MTVTLAALAIPLLCTVIGVGTVLFLRLRKQKSLVYLGFFTVFAVYLYFVLDYTLFQYQSLLLMKYFLPGLMLQGQAAGHELNLVPLLGLTAEDLKTSLLNILLLVPFGFGLPFVARFRLNGVVLAGVLFSVAIELSQFASGRLAGVTFRITDINDVLFNAAGTAVGFLLFLGFRGLFSRVYPHPELVSNPLLRYIAELCAGPADPGSRKAL